MSAHRALRGRHRHVHSREDRLPARLRPGGRRRDARTEGAGRLERAGTERRRGRRVAGMVTGFSTATVLTAAAAWAIITAIATGSGDVGSATLKLTQTGNGAGLTTAISGMLPGDVQNRFVTVENAGTADGQKLTLGITSASANKLVTNASLGLQVSVTGCPVPWTTTDGTCSQPSTLLLSSTAVANMGTARTLGLGDSFTAGALKHLKVSLALPDQAETTINGALPSDSIQGLTAKLDYTFTMEQRGVATTNG